MWGDFLPKELEKNTVAIFVPLLAPTAGLKVHS